MAAWRTVLVCVLLAVSLQGAHCQDVRVKLCGREFIRMVVTSCGSSRLRRSAAEIGHPHGNQSYPDANGQVPLQGDHPPIDDPTGPRAKVTGGPPAIELWRSRRSAGPAGVCCRSGCTLSELVQYC
ncbi:insulin-like 3 (Leydig cell) [Anguilla anguilla]|uniref:insulin-like 3 (Leydig cell) n=2 Tax=Anguilla TaxID=7935 RepID=UPI0015B06C26|nr:insulin-like 3 (Leydig cell) [Anguilla anguilla]